MDRRRITLVCSALLVGSFISASPLLAGSVSGTIRYDGAEPPKKALKMDADPGCAKKHSSPAYAEQIVLGSGGDTLANVLVYVKGSVGGNHSAPSEPVVMDQNGCRYMPHVIGIMVGQPFKVLNSDGLLHNVHSLPEVNSSFNRAMPANVKEAEYVFSKPEAPFKIKCDVHPWMGAYVGVFEHPFFAVSDENGKFKIDGLPNGTYEIEAWHEFKRFAAQSQSVTVGGDESIEFTFKGPPKK